MRKINYGGFNIQSFSILFLSLILFISSCEQEDKIIPDPSADNALDVHFQFLTEISGVDREDIVYDKANEQFLVSNDMIVSKSTVDEYLLDTDIDSKSNGRTEQRRHNILLSNANATNFRYYIQPSVPAAWRDAAIQAIYQWNNVGGSKLRLVQVGTQAEANINVFVGTYDEANWVARATLPTSAGTGYLEINPRFNGMEAGQKLFTMVHEMGHNIGFWHTNQTTGDLIPGTPVTDANSVMNSFVLPWNGFTDYDKIAVRYLYPSTGAFSTTIQAESYSTMSGIATENTTDAGGGQNVGWIETGDWMAYNNINIPSSGSYLVEYRVASPNGACRLSLDVNAGATVLGMLDIPNTGGWQNWTTVSHTVNISAGTYNFGLFAQTGGWNINWLRITKR